MGIHLAGEPVWFNLILSTSTGPSTVGLSIYTPGQNTARTLLATEQLALLSLSLAVTGSTGLVIITSLAAGTTSTGIPASTVLMEVNVPASNCVEWHDDGTAALSGVPGVVPSVVCSTAAPLSVIGTGLITNNGMGTTRPSFLANLTQNPNGQF